MHLPTQDYFLLPMSTVQHRSEWIGVTHLPSSPLNRFAVPASEEKGENEVLRGLPLKLPLLINTG